MNARRVNAAAGVILAAQKQRSTAAGIAMSLEAAGLLQSPESAAELVELRARVDKVERAYTFDTAELKKRVAELEKQAAVVAEFTAQRAEYVTSLLNCHPDNGHDYDRWQGHAAARRQLSERLGLPVAWPAEAAPAPVAVPVEDPHDSPLHHAYQLGRDLDGAL